MHHQIVMSLVESSKHVTVEGEHCHGSLLPKVEMVKRPRELLEDPVMVPFRDFGLDYLG